MQVDLEPKRPLVTALGFTAAIFNFVLVVSAATPAEPRPPTPRVTYLRLDQVRVVKPVEDRIHQCSRPCYAFYSPSGIPIAQGPQVENYSPTRRHTTGRWTQPDGATCYRWGSKF